MSNQSKIPYSTLGKHLKYVREQSRQSIAEVSGAVEIEEQMLQSIEAGEVRPAEDILLLLISHFDVQDQEALQLWELANYDGELPDRFRADTDIVAASKVVMLMAYDMRTMYSDGVDVQVTNSGVTLNFTQASGPSQSVPVARVGMSSEQAEKVLDSLQRALLHIKYNRHPRALPPATDDVS